MKDRRKDRDLGRRDFLKGAVVGGAAAATATGLPQSAQAQASATAPAAAGYEYLNIEEAAFVEALKIGCLLNL